MTRKKLSLSDERALMINMIVSTKFLNEVMPLLDEKLLQSSYSRILTRWVKEYWKHHKESPGKNIEDIYKHKVVSIEDDSTKEQLSDFLESLSEEWGEREKINYDYEIKKAINYLDNRSIKILAEDLEIAAERGDNTKGNQLIATYKRVELPSNTGIDITTDSAKIIESFYQDNELLFRFPGKLGSTCGDFLRGDLVSFLASQGKGKSWFLLYSSRIAMDHGFNVLFVSLEMPWRQVVRRSWQILTAKPRKSGTVTLPYFEKSDSGLYVVKSKKQKRKGIDAMTVKEIEEEQEKIRRQSRTGKLYIETLATDSVTIEQIEERVDNLYYFDNFSVDVIVIDYADLLMPSEYFREYRHKLDAIWKRLRRLSQERNVLVLSASQTGRQGTKKDSDQKDIAEDIRKLGHVSKMMVLNQSQTDYEKNVMRLKVLKDRDRKRTNKEVVILQSLDIGSVCIDSRQHSEVDI